MSPGNVILLLSKARAVPNNQIFEYWNIWLMVRISGWYFPVRIFEEKKCSFHRKLSFCWICIFLIGYPIKLIQNISCRLLPAHHQAIAPSIQTPFLHRLPCCKLAVFREWCTAYPYWLLSMFAISFQPYFDTIMMKLNIISLQTENVIQLSTSDVIQTANDWCPTNILVRSLSDHGQLNFAPKFWTCILLNFFIGWKSTWIDFWYLWA